MYLWIYIYWQPNVLKCIILIKNINTFLILPLHIYALFQGVFMRRKICPDDTSSIPERGEGVDEELCMDKIFKKCCFGAQPQFLRVMSQRVRKHISPKIPHVTYKTIWNFHLFRLLVYVSECYIPILWAMSDRSLICMLWWFYAFPVVDVSLRCIKLFIFINCYFHNMNGTIMPMTG